MIVRKSMCEGASVLLAELGAKVGRHERLGAGPGLAIQAAQKKRRSLGRGESPRRRYRADVVPGEQSATTAACPQSGAEPYALTIPVGFL